MKKLIFSALISFCVFADSDSLLPEYNHNFVVDPFFSPYVGADDLIIAHQMLEDLHLNRFGQPVFSKTPTMRMLGRGAELLFFWEPVNYVSMVTQHEVFGHGYRARSTPDVEVMKYKIGVPPPYGRGGGFTQFRYYPDLVSVFAMINMSSGGVESTSILANKLRLNWLKEEKISPEQASLYHYSQHDITHYILYTDAWSDGDMNEYADLISRVYGQRLELDDLRKGVYLNYLDPFTYYSIYSMGKYIIKGTDASIPMIPLGSYKYLPSLRMGLTPFGPEYYLENFLMKEHSPIYFYLRRGSFADHRYMGLGIEYPHLWQSGQLSLGFRADAWVQPAISFKESHYSLEAFSQNTWKPLNVKESRVGSAVSVIYQDEFWRTTSIFAQVGVKSQGYLPGEGLDAGVIVRVGLKLW